MQHAHKFNEYPNDPRGADCLIFGFSRDDRPLHTVCGKLEEEEVLIITAYEPDPKEWEEDWKTKKKGGVKMFETCYFCKRKVIQQQATIVKIQMSISPNKAEKRLPK